MVRLKSADEIEMMRLAGRVVAEALAEMRDAIVPDRTRTIDLDEIAGAVFEKRGAKSAFLGYKPSFSAVKYRYHTCLSVNEEVVHGLPGKRVLQSGDIISIDTGASVGGWYADAAITVSVGEAQDSSAKLLTVTRDAMYAGIAQAVVGNRIGDISAAIQRHAESFGFGVVRSMVGHGIGRSPHEEPQVPNYGRPGQGVVLKPGMVICIEPMVNIGTHEISHVPGDDWTIVTTDRSLSAHFEHTVAITEGGPDLLTGDPRLEK